MLLFWKFVFVLPFVCAANTTGFSGSEGRRFAVAFHQTRSDVSDGACVIHMIAKQQTQVTISEPDGGRDTFTIFPNSPYSKSYDSSYRVIQQLETEAFLIDSSDDISVLLSNYRDDGHMSTALALPIQQDDPQEYMVLTYPSVDENTCATYTTCAFYTVVPEQDMTEVKVYRLINGEAQLLHRRVLLLHEVLSDRTLHTPDTRHYDFSGYLITADKPIAVTAGNPCANTDIRRTGSSIWSSMPSVQQTGGTRYISHTLNYRGFAGPTLVRIMALSNNTLVTFEGSSALIRFWGQFIEYSIDSGENSVFECNKPCMAAQYSVSNINITPGGSAVSMSVLASTDKFSHDVRFTKPEVGNPSDPIVDYMSIVYLTESPEDSPLFYDGVELSGWNVTSGAGFSNLEIELSGSRDVVHSLSTAGNGPGFSALIHGQGENSIGYAYTAGFGDGIQLTDELLLKNEEW